MEGLLFFHSLWRYVVLILLVLSILFAFKGYFLNGPILIGERKVWIFAVMAVHIQLLIGLIMYFLRFRLYGESGQGIFWKYEHAYGMILAVVLITVGRALSKRARDEKRKQLLIGVFFLLGLLLMFSLIPWPWSEYPRKWI